MQTKNFFVVVLAGAALSWAIGYAAEPPASFTVGVGAHFAEGGGVLPVNLSVIREAGITSIRGGMRWQFVETQKGRYAIPETFDAMIDQAVAAGLQPLPILGGNVPFFDNNSDRPHSPEALEDLAKYCEFMARRFKGKVRMYELFNEWDAPSRQTETPGAVDAYVNVLKAVYPRMKAVDPSIVILGGALTSKAPGSGWLESFLRAGALQYLDAVSIHTYRNQGAAFPQRGAEGWASAMQRIDELVRKYSGARQVPIYVTEMGWTTELNRGTRPGLAAAYLARMYLLARTLPFLKGIWWYDFEDDGWGATQREHNFGLVHADLTPKPAYYAMAGIANFVSTAEYLGRIETADPDIWALKFRRPDGKDAWAIWSAHEDDYWQVTLRSSQANPAPVSVSQVGRAAFQHLWGTRERGPDAPVIPNQMTVLVGEMPWLVVGDLSAVRLTGVERREFPELTRPPKGPGGDQH
jgi:hypothetical protein